MTLQHDEQIEIAIGKSRKDISWKNTEMLWSEFIQRLSTTHRTAETCADYMKAVKGRQDEIKDIGGYVGGYLSTGRRKSANVVTRSLIVLDADFPPPGLWEDFTMLYGCAAAMHTTHKHSPANPRVRLIIPLDRPVDSGEYEPIARRIASMLNMNRFDHTTYETARLMYWPSTSKDGEYLFKYQDGIWLCADRVLSTYRDYKDSSEWPVSETENTVIRSSIKAQEDPLTKRGIIGAFCRTYAIEDAIETFLGEEYSACDVEGRYTYIGGSTAAGLVVYDSKFTYSHHGTDPVSGMLCNAFDLVRIHKYGSLDGKVQPGTPTSKRPSHAAMCDFAVGLPAVRTLVADEKYREAVDDFSDVETDEVVTDTDGEDWKAKLKMDRKCNIFSTVENMVVILENDPRLVGRFGYDQFRQRPVLLKNLPWRKVTKLTKYVRDEDESQLYLYLEKHYGITAVKLDKALHCIYDKNAFHPVQVYLSSVVWDNVRRVETMLVDYMGCEDSAYMRAITRKTLVGAVARIFEPGIKFDTVLTLVGDEGKQKSTLFAKLGKEWFSSSFNFSMIRGKEGCEQLQGVWIMEVGEMAGLRKADKEDVKAFISRQEDSYRPAYGRNLVTVPRQGIITSSVNELDFLQEGHGHRRIWPAKILINAPTKSVAFDLTPDEVDQLWAEAVALYRSGEKVYLPPALENAAREIQRAHTEEHPWTDLVVAFLAQELPATWKDKSIYERLAWLNEDDETRELGVSLRSKVCISELWCEALGRQLKDLTHTVARDLHSIMRMRTNWKQSDGPLKFGKYGQQRKGYVLKDVPVTK